MGEWECGFSIDGGWILMEDDSLCGGRNLLEGLHARFRSHAYLGRNSLHFERANGNAGFR